MAQNNRSKQSSSSDKRGFASMDPEKQRAIASMGGKASHKNDGNRAANGSTGNTN